MRMMSCDVTVSPAASRCSTKSKPFTFGDRAHPGSPITGMDLVASYTNVKTEYAVGTAAQTGAIFDIFTPRHQFPAIVAALSHSLTIYL